VSIHAPDADSATEQILGADGEFHVTDEPVDLSVYAWEDWIAFGLFWALAATVFYQFFTRYALNDSASWTEEIARYLLICTVFVGASVSVRKNTHIHVDIFYRFMPRPGARALSTFVDAARIVFFAYAAYLTVLLMGRIGRQQMAIIDWPIGIIYGVVLFGFILMCYRSVTTGIKHWRQGFSVLERPEVAGSREA
jgi:TRAP-type C4-dicarboxylate transport system permease small subunit